MREGESEPEDTVDADKVVAADFLSRFFAPKTGIDEDPVTGSAHCTLAPYWSTKLGKERVVGHQTSSRGGVVECVMAQGECVDLTGIAVTAVSGKLYR
jgi:predicted PhzF superfamily epimerase YddE/YHI9